MKPTMKALRTVLKALSLLAVIGSCGLLEADPSEATITSPTGPITVALNQTVTFTASSADSVQYDSYRVNSFTWNFGDGMPSVLGSGPSGVASHAYASPGIYTATLTVSYTVGTCLRPIPGPDGGGCLQYSYRTLTATATRTITVLAPPSISSFTASPTTVAPGGASTLSWTTANATSLTVSGVGTVGGTSTMVYPTATTTYTLTATNAAGSVTATATVNVIPLPTISGFTASPTTVASGAASTLSWTTANATSLTVSGVGTVGGTSTMVYPTATTTYTLTATNAAGSVTATATVNVIPLPTISGFTASPTTVASGAASTLSWTTTNATSLSISGVGTVGGTSTVVNPTATTTYTLTATNAAGSVTATATVNVMALPTISSFIASPTTVAPGGASTLSWTTTNATSLSISGIGAVTGTSRVVNPTATTTYTLTATNAAGSVTATATVNVMALPTISSFIASPTTVAPGGASTLSWTTTNATNLSISGIGTVTGTSKVVNPTATTTYTLTATNAAGSVTATRTVTVMALPTIGSFTASPTTVAPGAASTLSWTTTNATSLSISGIGTVTGTSKVVNPTVTTTYTLTATNAAGSVTSNAVTITAKSWVLKLKKDVVYVGTKEVAEVDAQGAVRITLVDHLGSPRFLVGPTGVLESTQKYLPFGESLADPASAAKFAKGFTNHEQTDPSGLIYMQARFYAPWYGRFLSPDPARDQHFEETQSWNIYSYVQNNPTMNIDPTGMWELPSLGQVYDKALDVAAAGLTYGKMVPGLGAGIMLGEAASMQRVDTSGNIHEMSGAESLRTGAIGALSLGLQVVGAGVPAGAPAGGISAGPGGAAALQPSMAVSTTQVSAATAGAAVPAAMAMSGGPTLGQNPKNDVPKGQTNTDLPGGKSTGKSIFKNQTKGQKVTQQTTKDGKTIRTSEDGSKIRMDPAKGKTNVELPNRGIGKENIHLRD